MTYTINRLGSKYAGNCVRCGRSTGGRPFELADTLLLKSDDGRWAVAHPVCCGVKTKGCVGGGRKIAGGPDSIKV